MWLSPRAGTDGDLFGAMLRYILENDNQNDPNKKYIDWSFKNTLLDGMILRQRSSHGGTRKTRSTD